MDLFMQAAIAEAEAGLAEGGIPIGSVVVHEGTIVGRGHNRRVQQGSAILHGEMDALERTGRRPASFYRECTLYTTLSPLPDVQRGDRALPHSPGGDRRESLLHGRRGLAHFPRGVARGAPGRPLPRPDAGIHDPASRPLGGRHWRVTRPPAHSSIHSGSRRTLPSRSTQTTVVEPVTMIRVPRITS